MSNAEMSRLEDKLKLSLAAIKKLKQEIAGLKAYEGPVAVIGMSCQFPGNVYTPEDYWKLLLEGKDAITEIPRDRWDVDSFYNPDPAAPGRQYVRHGGFLRDIDQFDPFFFGISPNEAEAIDPQQRLLLQHAWQTFEYAGIPVSSLKGSDTGVFVGLTATDYFQKRAGSEQYNEIGPYDVTGNIASTAAGRISYTFDFKGPAIALDTACSSSLVAVHLACQSLLAGESSLALAGGVNIMLEPNAHIIFSRMNALAPDGRCKAFDAAANGFIRSEGCGMVLLKRLSDAVRDNNRILAVIRGSAVNQDGYSNGLTAPNGAAQQEVIRKALQVAGMASSDISFIETHGTGTPLGDPIEIEAINRTYANHRTEDNPLYIGSVKNNIGHLEGAAGIASLIKTVLVLNRRVIPLHPHFKTPNPYIDWKETVKVPLDNIRYGQEEVFTAGVSAFGFSGTNAHLLLSEFREEAPPAKPVRPFNLIPFSASTQPALQEMAGKYKAFLQQASWEDFCYTINTGRSQHLFRAAFVADGKESAVEALEAIEKGNTHHDVIQGKVLPGTTTSIAFLFSGQGAQYEGMGRELYEAEPVFRAALDQCAIVLAAYNIPLLDILLSGTEDLNDTLYTQPCLFSLEYALFHLWADRGVKPAWVAGHSLGEYVAACCAGIFSLEDALKLVTARSRLIAALPRNGAMAAISLGSEEIRGMLTAYRKLSIAAVNGPRNIVVSGDSDELNDLIAALPGNQVKVTLLKVSHAFHSPLVRPVLDEFASIAGTVEYRMPVIPIVSLVTGKLADTSISTAGYWTAHIMAPVLFEEGIRYLEKASCRIFLELGPQPVLTAMATQILTGTEHSFIHSLQKKGVAEEQLLKALGRLFINGVSFNGAALYRDFAGKTVTLPFYPFQNKSYWINTALKSYGAPAADHERIQPFSTTIAPYVADHRIENAIVYPAACYTEMVLEAIYELEGEAPVRIYDLEFEKAFVPQEQVQYDLRTVLRRLPGKRFEYTVYSRPASPSTPAWEKHMTGKALLLGAAEIPAVIPDREAIKESALSRITGAAFYEKAHRNGNHWGDAFQGITHIWKGKDTALSYQSAPAAIMEDLHSFRVHPAWLDICGQLLAATVEGNGAFMGKSVAAIDIYQPMRDTQYWSYATLSSGDAHSRTISGNVTVFTDEGKVVAQTTGLEFEFISNREMLHKTTWIPFDGTDDNDKKRILLYHTGALFAALSEQGYQVNITYDLTSFAAFLEQGNNHVLFAAKTPADLGEVMHCLIASTGKNNRLWLLTTDLFTDTSTPPYAAISWGWGNTLYAEYRQHWGGWIDIDSSLPVAQQAILTGQLLSDVNAGQKFRISATGTTVAQLTKYQPPQPIEAPVFKEDVAYLITGGLGALGLLTAQWMAGKGAKCLLLMSRNPPQDMNAIRKIEDTGAVVKIITLDISDDTAFCTWLESWNGQGMPAIKGVVHAAGQVAYIPSAALTPELWEQQLAAKVTGTLVLDRYLREQLDFMVLYASAATLQPSPGLGAYAGANEFLNIYAQHARLEGRQVLSINWGAWAGIGLVARQKDSHLALQQIDSLQPAEGLAILETIWNSPEPVLAALPPGKAGIQQRPVAAPGQTPAAIVCSVLKLDPADLDPDMPLSHYGLDSMMAIEIRNRLETSLNVSINMVDLIKGPSVRQLEKMIRAQTGESEVTAASASTVMTPGTPFELSYGQQSLWSLYAIDENSPAYNVAFSFTVNGMMDGMLMKQAFLRLIERHASLRTAFRQDADGKVTQFTKAPEEENILDFSIEPATGMNEDAFRKMVVQAYRQPFDLTGQGPLVRVRLFRKTDTSCVLLICIHHIVCDGWSLWILLEELKELYAACVEQRNAALPVIEQAYYDFISWQKNMLESETGRLLETFWMDKLSGELPVLNLPVSHRAADERNRGASLRLQLSAALSGQLRDLSRKEGVTLYVTMLSAFQLLLQRYSGQDDIIIGTPVAGRGNAVFTGIAGDFINMVPLRTHINSNLTFSQYLQQTKAGVMEALQHQDYPFPLLVKKLQPKRIAGRSPVFNVVFSLQKPQAFPEINALLAGEQTQWGVLNIAPFEIPQQEGQFDLTLEFVDGNQEMLASLKYNDALFDRTWIERMWTHFVSLLHSITRQAALPLARQSLFPTDALSDMLQKWSTPAATGGLPDINAYIARQVIATPTAIALAFADDTMTFAQLDEASNRMARYLLQLSLKPGDIIGLCTPRNMQMVVAMLGILKAGMAYLPLDPLFPSERLDYIVKASRLQYILVDHSCRYLFSAFDGTLLNMQADKDRIAAQPATSPLITVTPEDIAYVIYTSGSTGQPKGIAVTHGNVAAFFEGMDHALGKKAGTWLAVTTISFDIAVLELLWTLSNGSKVVIQENAINIISHEHTSFQKEKKMDFSLFYFASADNDELQNRQNKYKLLIEGARFADENGYTAVWTPERHFHQFGGLYPNPSVTSAAIAAVTRRIAIRAGSIVAPLNNPLRIAEDWSVIDNLSNGRAGISFASGWQANDFVLSKDSYKDRHQVFYKNIDMVKRLWKGETVSCENGEGEWIDARIFPRPVQKEIPVWITAAGNINTFIAAGAMGANLLTHLLTQSLDELKEKIAAYKKARYENGFDPDTGTITLMVHTFVDDDPERAKDIIRKPFINYLRDSLELMSNMARAHGLDPDEPGFKENHLENLLEKAFERYYNTAGLLGTPKKCELFADQASRAGITELACLIDFGIAYEQVMESLVCLNKVKTLYEEHNITTTPRYSFAEQVKRHQVTHLQCTPSLARMLLADHDTRLAMEGLEQLLLGGEQLPLSLVKELYQHTKADIFNMYGPTETTVWSSVRKIERTDERIFLGAPIPGTDMYVLDKDGNHVPATVPGELFIGGAGVSKGYLYRPELTAQRFITRPDGGKGWLYKTGDMVAVTLDGNMEYLGRTDNQVKIYGHRIELEDIEATMMQHISVKNAAVIALHAPSGEHRLIAYIVARELDAEQLSAVAWKQWLQARLPDYMIPVFFSYIDQLPLTPNGKVDRNALKERKPEQPAAATGYVAPSNKTEQVLTDIWRQLLSNNNIGVTDNFFTLGGDSVLSIQLVAKAKEAGIYFSVNQLFSYQTISELAAVVTTEDTDIAGEQGILTGVSPLLPVQQWFFDLELEVPGHYNQALLLHIPPAMPVENIKEAVQALLEQHDVLRSRFIKDGDGQYQQVLLPAETHEVTDIYIVADDADLKQDTAIVQGSLHLENGPVFRCRMYVDQNNIPLRLLLVAHHLVIDGISWRILLDDLYALLRGTGPLPAKTTSYRKWVETAAAMFIPDAEKDYWKKLAGTEGHTILPANNLVSATVSHTAILDKEYTAALLHEISSVYNTSINDILLTALYLTISEWNGQEQFLVDLESHGREAIAQTDVSRTVGWFTAIYPVRLYPAEEKDIISLLKHIKELLRAVPGNGLGFGQLRYGKDPVIREMLQKIPVADILFNYLGQTDKALGKWELAGEDAGPLYSPLNKRTHLLEMVSMVLNNEYRITCNFSSLVYDSTVIARLTDRYLEHLKEIIDQCRLSATGGFTPSDFPGLKMDQRALDALLSGLK